MTPFLWRQLPLENRIRWLRYGITPVIVIVVILYQLVVARTLADEFGHSVHYWVEIAFYSMSGPMVTWLTLIWIERRVAEKDSLEKQVRAQTQQLASLTATSADAILSLDHMDRIVSWNQGAAKLFGYTKSEIIGAPLGKLLRDTSALEERLQRDGWVQEFETTAVGRDGRVVTVELTQTRITGEVEDELVSLLIIRDITARRERDAILEEERARIARDLHDGVAQTLYFLSLKADMARGQVFHNPQKVTGELKEIGSETRRVIREVRRTIFALRPLDWTNGGFFPALQRFVDGYAEQVGWQVDFDIDRKVLSLPTLLEPTVFRLVQESLNNVAKHARARRVEIQLRRLDKPHRILLRVSDDGSGFDQTEADHGGLGLGQMQRRVATLGGEFSVKSQSGRGTIVSAQLPLPGANYEKN